MYFSEKDTYNLSNKLLYILFLYRLTSLSLPCIWVQSKACLTKYTVKNNDGSFTLILLFMTCSFNYVACLWLIIQQASIQRPHVWLKYLTFSLSILKGVVKISPFKIWVLFFKCPLKDYSAPISLSGWKLTRALNTESTMVT